ncbi:MAG: AAA family ATPase [Bacteroidaceae bacterium]|nr:AAA family ATPase [Bacteroidaceae bacterium]
MATCTTVAKNNGESASHYIGKINGFAKWVKSTIDRFQILGTDGNETFWLIPMQKGYDKKHGFEWQLRDELVEALRIILTEKLLDEYKSFVLEKGTLDKEGCDELYKWRIASEGQGLEPIRLINRIAQSDFNLIDMQRSKPSLVSLAKNEPELAKKFLNGLQDESIDLAERIKTFHASVKKVWREDLGKTVPNDERTIAAILATYAPTKYCYYKWDIYDIYCRYFGIEEKNTRQCYIHFLNLMNDLYNVMAKDEELTSLIYKETDAYVHSEIFLAQDVVWQMHRWMDNQLSKNRQTTYWLAGYTLDDEDCREQFYKDSVWMGVGSANVNKEIESVCIGDVIMLKSTYTKGADHKTSTLKISAVGKVTSKATKGDKFYSVGVDWISFREQEFTQFEGAYRLTFHRVADDLFINYAKEQLNMTTTSKYQEYIDLLKEAKNLVLTGAPGTGKTFMAQAIAEEMGAEMKFVQFHPSYDYTDFVEGLRPIDNGDGQMGFERKNGVFKKFCEEAIDSLSWQNKLGLFLDDALKNRTLFETERHNVFQIMAIKDNTIEVYNEKVQKDYVKIRVDDILDILIDNVQLNQVGDISKRKGFDNTRQEDSYIFSIVKEIRKSEKPYIMIIDEINRGEASKIFGELFYAIDPGYRGKTDVLVQTQYQNLVPESDVFAKGFYVPENVYILATMNDIDRSVESMDFAMRRRFTWMEVAPTDTENMLDVLGEPLAAEAKTRMHNLNKAIAYTEGLGEAYMIGPSYFLKLKDNGGDFSKLWKMNIEPLLKEYLRGFRKAKDSLKKFEKAYSNVVEVVSENTSDTEDDED